MTGFSLSPTIVDWSNVVLGGGSVLACLTNRQGSPQNEYSDFDFFLYGLKPEEVRAVFFFIIAMFFY
jgi:hypothetical protein